MVFVVVALVAITGYAMIFIAYWDKLGNEDHHYGIPIIGVFIILVRASCIQVSRRRGFLERQGRSHTWGAREETFFWQLSLVTQTSK